MAYNSVFLVREEVLLLLHVYGAYRLAVLP